MQSPTETNLTESKLQAKNSSFYYGWIVLAALLVTMIIRSGIRLSFGVFFKPLEVDFGLSRALTSEIFSLYMIFCGVFAVIGGWAIDRYEPRILFTMMGFFTGLSLLLTSQATELWHIFISYSVLFAIGTGPVYALPLSIASRWFVKRRGLAVGIVTSGAGIGIMLMPLFSAWLITGYGWQTSYFILAMIALFILISSALLLKGAPDRMAGLPDSEKLGASKPSSLDRKYYGKTGDFTIRQAAKTSIFWLLLCIPFFVAFCAFIVMTHIVPHAIDLGINQVQAASILSFTGGASILGTLLMGRASDSIGRKPAIMISVLLMAVAMLWVVWSYTLWMFYLFAIVFGFSYGGISSPVNALIGDVFGTRHLGVIMAVLSAPFSIGAAVGPALAGYIFDISGSYVFAFLAGMVAALITAILALFLRVPEVRKGEEAPLPTEQFYT